MTICRFILQKLGGLQIGSIDDVNLMVNTAFFSFYFLKICQNRRKSYLYLTADIVYKRVEWHNRIHVHQPLLGIRLKKKIQLIGKVHLTISVPGHAILLPTDDLLLLLQQEGSRKWPSKEPDHMKNWMALAQTTLNIE